MKIFREIFSYKEEKITCTAETIKLKQFPITTSLYFNSTIDYHRSLLEYLQMQINGWFKIWSTYMAEFITGGPFANNVDHIYRQKFKFFIKTVKQVATDARMFYYRYP